MSLLILGKILGTHHLKGEVKVLSEMENLERLVGEKIIVEFEDKQQRLLTVKSVKHFVQNKWSFIFNEINNKKDADFLRNSYIKVRREVLGISDDEHFLSETIGMEVIDVSNGMCIGKIEEIYETAAHNIFVARNKNYETMIPDVDEFILNIDYEERKIYVKLIDGLMEDISIGR